MQKLIICAILLAILLPAHAQLVNIEKRRKSAESDKWYGKLDFAVNLNENTNQIIQGKNAAELQYSHKASTFLFFNDLQLMRVNNESLVNSGFQHLRYNYTFKDSSFLTLEAFAQNQYNSIKKLENRVVSGFGPRFRLISTDRVFIYLSTLGMYEYEKIKTSDTSYTYTSVIKGDFYLSGGLNFNNKIKANHVTYYQPNISNWSDYRLSSETALYFKFTDMFSFKVAFNFAYDSDPPVDVPKLFYTLSNGLSIVF